MVPTSPPPCSPVSSCAPVFIYDDLIITLIFSLLAILFFDPEPSPGEYQSLIPPKLFFTGQLISDSNHVRSHSL